MNQYPREVHIDEDVRLKTLVDEYQHHHSAPIVAAIVDGHLRELHQMARSGSSLEFVDISSEVGMKIYLRSLIFLFIKACKDIFPDAKVHIQHSLGNSIYCEINKEHPLEEEDVKMIEDRMRSLMQKDIPFAKSKMSVEDASKMFKGMGLHDKARVLKYRSKPSVNIYDIQGHKDYLYGYMVPSTGFLKWFKLKFYLPGVILQYPSREKPEEISAFKEQPKLSKIFRESDRWAKILEVTDAGALNDLITSGKGPDILRISEALHEKKIAQIADEISEERDDKRIILISGPSSSGKTTFAHRLMVQLMVNGLRPISISIDDYFLDRDQTPIDEFGKPDFESIDAIDLKLFNLHMTKLIQGQRVSIPKFNFNTGKREDGQDPIRLAQGQPLIIEGIHGLNEVMTSSIPHENKYKIYVSALTQLGLDHHNRISTTATRLLRRIVRDSWRRNADVRKTISMWPSVLRGAKKYIFSFQEEADIMFNSALVYELPVLKKYAEPLLEDIGPTEPEYLTANHLLKFLEYFVPLEDESDIPKTSIIREFIGGCAFYD